MDPSDFVTAIREAQAALMRKQYAGEDDQVEWDALAALKQEARALFYQTYRISLDEYVRLTNG